MATLSPIISSPPPSSQYSHLIHLLHTRLPQELFDQIKYTVYEMLFCPGHVYLDVSSKDTEAIEENVPKFQRPLEVARPEMLCLSKNTYQNFAVRMWQENVCIVKTESGKVRQMELVRGHLENPLGYLKSIGEDPISIQGLCIRRISRAEDYQFLNAVMAASQTPVEGLPNCVLSFAITLEDFKKQPFFNEIYSKVSLVHRYGPSGEWLGLDIRQPNRDDLWDSEYFSRGGERSFGIMWKALSVMTDCHGVCHGKLLPEMANQQRKTWVQLIHLGQRMYIFTE
ncbi:MAG: hypothetical protein LQ337_007885 [Flavoplaca oasis]|nr:MAG: hypothetical protein LQ337_007885 [Flavoplaca oasis]